MSASSLPEGSSTEPSRPTWSRPSRRSASRSEPLSVGAVHRLLSDRLGRAFPRQTLLRIHERSAGNPFFALEIARALEGDVDPLEPLPVPQTLDGLVRVRLEGPPAGYARCARFRVRARNIFRGSLARVGVAEGSLDPALAEHVVERENGTIRFTHPLLSSALYNDLGDQRQSVHARIAEVVGDPVVRARHLAQSRTSRTQTSRRSSTRPRSSQASEVPQPSRPSSQSKLCA